MTSPDTPQAEPTGATPRSDAPRIVLGGLLVLLGLLWFLDTTGAAEIGLTLVLGLATVVTGIAVMVLSRKGSQAGLIVFGSILAVVALVSTASVFEGFRGGVGDRTVTPTSNSEIAGAYNLAMGKLTVDLSEVDDLEPGTHLEAGVGLGELVVIVPQGIDLEAHANVGAGEIDILGRTADGVGLDQSFESSEGSGEPDLVLELRVFLGQVEVSDE